jgi:predicted RNase H-like HicB family nuclease
VSVRCPHCGVGKVEPAASGLPTCDRCGAQFLDENWKPPTAETPLDAMRYTLLFSWNELERAWIAQVAELPEARAGGPTLAEALRELELTAQAWLEVAADEGREPPRPLGPEEALAALAAARHAADEPTGD